MQLYQVRSLLSKLEGSSQFTLTVQPILGHGKWTHPAAIRPESQAMRKQQPADTEGPGRRPSVPGHRRGAAV
jgi:hypothetical protein